MCKVAVLMSTYNGERYLDEQIKSILAQTDVQVTLLIRDDGSSDKTVEIIKDYMEDSPNIVLSEGSNIGIGNSFMQLVYDAGNNFDYYAFSDQDDVWLPEKLKNAIQKLSNKKGPSLYCSNQLLIDGNNLELGIRHKELIDTCYLQILCNNQVTGCTMVWDKHLQKLLSEIDRRPTKELLLKRIHDVWVAMVASVTGTIEYDENAFILYRQHEGNSVGAKGTGVIEEWKKKIKQPKLRNGRSCLASEIVEKYKLLSLDEHDTQFLNAVAHYSDSIKKTIEVLRKTSLICYYSGETKGFLIMKVLLHLF